jgi:hypothetical protein
MPFWGHVPGFWRFALFLQPVSQGARSDSLKLIPAGGMP